MKKCLFALMTIAVFVLTGCEKDNNNDNQNPTNGTLNGKWEAVAEYDLINGIWEESYAYESGEMVYEFKSNGKVTIYYDGIRDGEITYSYNARNKELIFMGLVCPVNKLTSTELELIGMTWDDPRYEHKTSYKRIN